MDPRERSRAARIIWRVAGRLHHFDFASILPAIARLPIGVGQRLAYWRGRLNAATGRDWRSMALGFRHVRAQTALGFRHLPLPASDAQIAGWVEQRYVAEARDEYEARLAAAHRLDELSCETVPPGALAQIAHRERGLVLLTPHFESFFLGIVFLARSGARVNAMSSSVTHDPRVDPAVQRHFFEKYRGLEFYLNGGQTVDHELGTRQFYRMLQRREVLVILCDAPVAAGGADVVVNFLGGPRRISGGAIRMAQSTGSDVGSFVCRHLGGTRYHLDIGPIRPASDPAALETAYGFVSQAILAHPGGWWAADLLPAMPLVQTSEPAPPPAPAPATQQPQGPLETIVLTDSPLAGSGELDCGLRKLRNALRPASGGGWIEASSAALSPASFLPTCEAPSLLVLLHPALLVTPQFAGELQRALAAAGAACAVAVDQRDAGGEWAIGYTSDVDFQRYVERRQQLPAHAAWTGGTPYAYLVQVAAARACLERHPQLCWEAIPATVGSTVVAPRAFVHSYQDYQQGTRAEMLELLPASVQRLLDVGGGEGHFARTFVEQRGGTAWLVEPSDAAHQAPRSDRLRVFGGRLEELDATQTGPFDAVSFLDVLEHLADPLAALIAARRFLRPGGLLLLSVPNAGHWSIVRDLAQGRFEYAPVGILCATHLRFFTARSLEQLLSDAGFEVVRWRRAGPPMPAEFHEFMAATQERFQWDAESLQTESLHVLAALR